MAQPRGSICAPWMNLMPSSLSVLKRVRVYPFFSPDGKWIGYCSGTDQKLKKIAISGGAPVTLCDASPLFIGASWGADDTNCVCGISE